MSKRKSRKRPLKPANRRLKSMRGVRYLEAKMLIRKIPPEVVARIIREELDRM